jgi:hypothetical protein
MAAPTGSRVLSAMGMSVTAPAGWEATIYRRPAGPGEHTFPVMHASTTTLPSVRGDYGSGVVELLGPDDVFVAVLDFGPEAANTALFSGLRGVPGLTPDAYQAYQLQRTITGQAGVQRFFSTGGRGYCLYSVVGSIANRIPLTARANQLIGSLRFDPQGLGE